MDTTESVSKGCFVFKGKKNVAKMSKYFSSERNEATKAQLNLFRNTWQGIDSEIERIQVELNSNMFQELLAFIETSAKRILDGNRVGSSAVNEIPTAALLTGVNTPDHSTMFTQFIEFVRESVTPHVAKLQARESTQVKHMLSKSISQLTQSHLNCLSDDEDDTDQTVAGVSSNMGDLVAWYTSKYADEATPVKKSPTKKRRSKEKRSSLGSRPALVIVFEDLGAFSASVLQDFIMICSNYIDRLPIVLVFGITTTITVIHRLLSTSVSSLLCIDKFTASPSSHHLSQLISKILLTPNFPFKLGPRVFQLLLDVFLYHDFSVINFTAALKFAVLDHFTTQPTSCLCCPLDIAMETLKSYSNQEVDSIRRLPSLMKFVEGQPKEIQFKLLLDDKYTKKVIREKLRDLARFHAVFYPGLKCLHALTCQLPRHPLGKQIRELYAMSLESNVTQTECYSEALGLLKCLCKDELTETLKRAKEAASSDEQTSDMTDEQLHDLLDSLDHCIQRLYDLDLVNPYTEVGDESPDHPAATVLPKKTDLHSLRKTLSEMKKNKVRSPYETLRSNIIDEVDVFFQSLLPCPTSLPLHEIYYYDSIATVKQYLYSAPRASLQAALSNPYHYLQCACCECEPGVILPSMPDICVVYKLHLECGRYINLYDWLQAFITVVGEGQGEAEGSTDDLLQARFIRAVSELQFLGFIKATKRKTDHVARLTWGGC